MSKSIIRAYTAWWPEEDVTTREEAQDQCVTEQWTAEYMKGEGFSAEDINIVEHLQVGDSHRFSIDGSYCSEPFDVVVYMKSFDYLLDHLQPKLLQSYLFYLLNVYQYNSLKHLKFHLQTT